jgi:hypothetical protein
VPSAPLHRALWASPFRAFHFHPQQVIEGFALGLFENEFLKKKQMVFSEY